LPPTSSLPPLSRLADCSLDQIADALKNLRAIYVDAFLPTVSEVFPAKGLPKHTIHDTSVPDSGYASAEEDDEDNEAPMGHDDGDAEAYDPDILRSDTFEREFAIRWLTGFTARSDIWVYSVDTDAESDARANLVDDAASVLAAFAGEDEEQPLTRQFTFALDAGDAVEVELNDAPLLSEDHTSVGLQSWGSSILLAELICAAPDVFGVTVSKNAPRVLELGAGTGLLSIVAAKVLQRSSLTHLPLPTIIATDYHPSVLVNLQSNVNANFSTSDDPIPIIVHPLDWQHPVYENELSTSFDIILAADVVYHPQHTRWIKACVERLLVRPEGISDDGGAFWLIIPVRPTGRHEGMSDTVEEVFRWASDVENSVGLSADGLELAILNMRKLERHEGVGRADEGGYKLYRIGWVHHEA